MLKRRIIAIVVLVVGIALGYLVIRSQAPNPPRFLAAHPFRLGLDLSGGSHLIYQADVSQIAASDIDTSMASVRDVIERRVNTFGVSEPVVQVQSGGFGSTNTHQLSIELPGVTDITKAEALIGQTPYLEFKVQSDKPIPQNIVIGPDGKASTNVDISSQFVSTGLNGKYLKQAQLIFAQGTNEPTVSLQFDDAGTKLFADITKANIGKVVAIYLDGQVISAPVVRDAITTGTAVISGSFTPEQAKALVSSLNSGALPVPISLISTETVGPTLGAQAVHAGIMAALIGFILVGLFLIIWYRVPGVVAVIALALYTVITLALYKLIPVTLSAAGIAGFIISIGMAVDANILIFERAREERLRGRSVGEALTVGFKRAWTSIRDANISSIIIAFILFFFGSSLIKGFALTFGLGVIISLISAITITRLFLRALPTPRGKTGRFFFSSGFSMSKK
ncbi:MAG: protein-export rane protein SecD, preprotein translocase subunit SecD [Candidatus Nomurabacteria bacterium]|nr:protein-export rane protein SecD, preprotein translocase subunit SecD [Candidatus Nomurabacteria bacterium]